MTTATAKRHRPKRYNTAQRTVVNMRAEGVTTAQVLAWFPEAWWNTKRNAWIVGHTIFVEPMFSLSDDDADATGEL